LLQEIGCGDLGRLGTWWCSVLRRDDLRRDEHQQFAFGNRGFVISKEDTEVFQAGEARQTGLIF
jgi:hypothetical protein